MTTYLGNMDSTLDNERLLFIEIKDFLRITILLSNLAINNQVIKLTWIETTCVGLKGLGFGLIDSKYWVADTEFPQRDRAKSGLWCASAGIIFCERNPTEAFPNSIESRSEAILNPIFYPFNQQEKRFLPQ